MDRAGRTPIAQILYALAVLFIVLAVIVSILSDKNWSKVVQTLLSALGIIFGGTSLRFRQ